MIKMKRDLWTRGALSLLAVSLIACLVYAYYVLPKDTSTISLWNAAENFAFCERDGLEPGDSFWIPASKQIREIEAALPLMLNSRKNWG